MGFIQKEWSNPISVNATELNRIEKGVKDSHDSIEILGGEISNLQLKQRQAEIDIQNLTNNSNILETLTNLQTIVNNNSSLIETLQNTSNLVTQEQLTNRLKSYLPIVDIIQNGTSIIKGNKAIIEPIIVDTFLNKNSNNPISNKAIATALENLVVKVTVPTKLAELKEDYNHRLVTDAEKALWNTITNVTFDEQDPTVPSWAKQPTKPSYEYNEILDTPIIYNSIAEFPDASNYALSSHNHDTTYAPISHTHDYSSVYASITHNHDSDYASKNHTHTEFSNIVDSTSIQSMIDTSLSSFNHTHTVLDITDLSTTLSNYSLSTHNHDSTYLKLSGGTLTGQLKHNSSTIDLTTNPSSVKYLIQEYLDTNLSRIGILGGVQETDGRYGMYIQVGNRGNIKLTATNSQGSAWQDTDVRFDIPNPAAAANDTRAATTKWSRDTFSLTTHNHNSLYSKVIIRRWS